MSENNKTTTSIIIAILAIAIIGGGVLIYNSSKDKDMKSDNASMMKKEDSVMVGGAAMYPSKDIITNVSNASNLTTLVTAVKAAGLVPTLQGPGPFTVFGPDNDSFAKLPAGTVETLLKPENKEKLTNILTYHVVSGTYKSTDLKDGQTLKTVNGQNLKVNVVNGKTMINGAMIKTADVLQSNGVAHVIDTVLIPEETTTVGGAAMYPSKDIVTNISNASNLTTVVAAVKAAGLVPTLQGPGPFTVFGPTNAAFAKLPAGTVETLLKPENKDKLTSILTYHVVSGIYKTTDLKDGQTLKTVNGQELKVMVKDGKTYVNGAMIETPNVLQSNGVAHVIDTVLIPS
ncbi:MAG: fasciclin domain-containing protein [candidate division SR1 bacterium]|nr:fasciclin domain-containing protein [candidate division SR1 bacterium]